MAESRMARIAFVGAGSNATESLMPNIAHIPEFDFVAVCDLDEGRAQHAARRFGALESYTDVNAMMDKVSPDGVCVCGPPAMHHAVVLQVLERGVPVFVEKPPAPTLAEAEELAAAAAEHGTRGMVGFMKRFAPANVVAKEYVSSEAFGRPLSITLIHGCGPYDDLRKMLMFNGIHMIDLGRYLMGDVSSVFAHGTESGGDRYAVSASMRFACGAVGQLNMNSGHTWDDCFEQTYVSGSGAGILNDASRATEVMSASSRFAEGGGLQMYGWSSCYRVSGNMAGWAAGGHYTRGYWGELSHFAKAVLGQVEPTSTLEDGVEAMRLIDRMIESIETGRQLDVA